MTETANTILVNRALIVEQKKLLIVRRVGGDSYNAGRWEYPGGKVDSNEELLAAAHREIEEETGLTVEIVPSLVHVETELIRHGKHANKLYVALFHAATPIAGEVVLSGEHQDYIWVGADDALSLDLTPESYRATIALRSFMHL